MDIEIRRVSTASDPGQLELSHDKLQILRPDLYGLAGFWQSIKVRLGRSWDQKQQVARQLLRGDSRAAVVVSTAPLLVAAYTDELDCVAMLRFPDSLVGPYGLKIGCRLLTVNFYDNDCDLARDLFPGPKNTQNWNNFGPLIADFLTSDQQRLLQRKKQISESEWQRTLAMGQEYLRRHPGKARDGRPIFSWDPFQAPPPQLTPWRPR
ncbi:MAG: hypothetical protein JNL67_08380 [Planctomycetaceae bacterium]|nr:hypothetical protein [Planctomycetaceae bacterium]